MHHQTADTNTYTVIGKKTVLPWKRSSGELIGLQTFLLEFRRNVCDTTYLAITVCVGGVWADSCYHSLFGYRLK